MKVSDAPRLYPASAPQGVSGTSYHAPHALHGWACLFSVAWPAVVWLLLHVVGVEQVDQWVYFEVGLLKVLGLVRWVVHHALVHHQLDPACLLC